MIPPTIWMFWGDGFDRAPEVVRMCLKQWQSCSPRLNFELLDRGSFQEFMPEFIDRDIPIQAISDILRARILSRHGGIWADATTIPTIDVFEWIGGFHDNDMLAFKYERSRYPLSSWFIAAKKDSYLMREWAHNVDEYWMNDRYLKLGRSGSYYNKNLNHENFLNVESSNVYPYFWFHYLFGDLIAKDRVAFELWSKVPPLSSDAAHDLQTELKRSGIVRRRKVWKKWASSPIHKLDWRMEVDEGFSRIVKI